MVWETAQKCRPLSAQAKPPERIWDTYTEDSCFCGPGFVIGRGRTDILMGLPECEITGAGYRNFERVRFSQKLWEELKDRENVHAVIERCTRHRHPDRFS